MIKRRRFISRALEMMGGAALLFSPLSSLISKAFAETKRLILPKDTKMKSLIHNDPYDLDTRNLQITPVEEFGTMGISNYDVDVAEWRLEVKGHVRKPFTIGYEELKALPPVEKEILLICPGFFAQHGRWKGVSIVTLLERAGLEPGATHVTVAGPGRAFDKVEEFDINDVLSGNVFLAYAVNGQVLPKKHGFPLRVVAQDYHGDDWVKYAHTLTAVKN